ncbi:hypothetical protein F66182_1234 [Fusarium sp. NRRL 66182]|nr:hypothetical protein F66182_1234 [Fusarium sp. NRRL 66182]
MPRKTRTPESLALNRENQRRSRARQRELLDHLQNRVREYERRDGQATLEMQRVARTVANENAALRGLLAAKGVPTDEVEAHIEAARHEERTVVKAGVSSATPVSTPSCAASPITIASRRHVIHRGQERVNTSCSLQPKSSPPPTPATTVTSCGEETVADRSGCCRRPQPQAEMQKPKSMDKIHCIEAATILAQIRGHPDISQARDALGCSSNNDCMVRNTDLLDLMDEMT